MTPRSPIYRSRTSAGESQRSRKTKSFGPTNIVHGSSVRQNTNNTVLKGRILGDALGAPP